MIKLSAQAAAMIYLLLTLGSLFALWLFQHFKGSRKKILPDREALYKCEYCHTAYTSDPLKKVNKCPECHSFNKENLFHLNKK
jgi:uncharacterized paraquat-inducible protein A